MNGNVTMTCKMIASMQKFGRRPCMIKLSDIETTPVIAYQHEIAWSKLLQDNGYISIAGGDREVCLQNTYDDTLKIYNSIKNTDIKSLLVCDRCVCPTYRNKKCNRINGSDVEDFPKLDDSSLVEDKAKHKVIKFYCTPQEKELVLRNAKASGKNVSQFIRSLCLKPRIFVYRYTCFYNANKKISELIEGIQSICFKISSLRSYTFTDLDHVLNLVSEICDIEKELVNSYQIEINTRTEELLEKIRKVCKDNIVTKVQKPQKKVRKTANNSVSPYISVKMSNEDYEKMHNLYMKHQGKIPKLTRVTNAYVKELSKKFCVIVEDYDWIYNNNSLFFTLNHYVYMITELTCGKNSYKPTAIYSIRKKYLEFEYCHLKITDMFYHDKAEKDEAISRELAVQTGWQNK